MSSTSITALTILLSLVVALAFAVRPRRASTVDFYLAGRQVGVVTNASAICGDYFSAASFLGVAAAVYVSGLDGAWYATGFAAGFVPVLLFVAAPLRRFGEFSIPDFLGRRMSAAKVRLTSVVAVQLIVISYLIPQAAASGITWQLLVGTGVAGMSPYATGVVVSTVAIGLIVIGGGMRGTTWAQAVQFLVLMVVLVWLAVVVVESGFSYGPAVGELAGEELTKAVRSDGVWHVETESSQLRDGEPARFGQPGAQYDQVGQVALLLTLIMGTAGLPHIMNRYFTSPTGAAARMTTVWVLGLSGVFYILAVMLGTAARSLIADAAVDGPRWLDELTVNGVLRVPEHALPVLGRLHGGDAGLGLVAAGALVAVMSTIAGLLLAAAASLGRDVYERHINPDATQGQAVVAGRFAVVAVAVVSVVLALEFRPDTLTWTVPSVIATMVTWAFALAGSTLTPALLLAIWWRRTTAAGVVAGIATGAVIAIGLLVAGLALEHEVLLTPTMFSAPAAVLAIVVVSLRTDPPADVDDIWRRLHGTASDRHTERLARLMPRSGATDGADWPAQRADERKRRWPSVGGSRGREP